MQVRRPPLREQRLVRAEPDRRNVVDQSVEPDVDDAAGIAGQRDPPRLAGAADRDVLEPGLDQTQDLVAAGLGLDESGISREVREQRILVGRQAEEVVLLLDPVHRAVQRTLTVDEISFLLERFAADAVPALVEAFVDIPFCGDAADEFLHPGLVPRLGRPDEIVVRNVEQIPRRPEFGFHAIAVRQGIHALFSGFAEDVLGVLVVAHDEQRLDTAEPFVTGDRVGGDLFVGGPEMRATIHIIDRRREVEAGRHIR